MNTAMSMLGRFAVLALIFIGAAALSNWPSHRSLPEGVGVLTLSFSHGADRKAACRKATPEELAALPANMRRPEICPRERPAIRIEFDIGGFLHPSRRGVGNIVYHHLCRARVRASLPDPLREQIHVAAADFHPFAPD